LTGWACQDQAQTQCGNVQDTSNSTAQEVQSSLATQIAKWKSDLNPLETYPIVSFGVAYSFPVRGGSGAR
jgi:hexokinase